MSSTHCGRRTRRCVGRGLTALFLASSLFPLLCISLARAADIPVTTTADTVTDSTECSLRAAVLAANSDLAVAGCSAGNGADTILLPAGVYSLTIAVDNSGAEPDDAGTGDLDIDSRLKISGAGVDRTVVNGNGIDRVFHVRAGAQMTLTGLTITGGRAPDGRDGESELDPEPGTEPVTVPPTDGEDGGAILNEGALALFGCALLRNRAGNGGDLLDDDSTATTGDAGYGGAIFSAADLALTDCLIAENVAGFSGSSWSIWAASGFDGRGGGIANTGVMTLTRVVLSGNRAQHAGGLYNAGDARVYTSTVGGNRTLSWGAGISPPGSSGARGGAGGGILNVGDLELESTSVINNYTGSGGDAVSGGSHSYGGDGGDGAGICNWGRLTIRRSTISNNGTGDGGDGGFLVGGAHGGDGGDGAGIANMGTLELEMTTIADNSCGEGGEGLWTDGWDGTGGGIFVSTDTEASASIHGSLLAGNLTAAGPNDCAGPLESTGYNLLEISAGCTITGTLSTLLMDMPAHLWSLGDYGGPMPTHFLTPGSPAYDSGTCQTAAGERLAGDQRGVARPSGGGCDIGAVEGGWLNPVWMPVIRR